MIYYVKSCLRKNPTQMIELLIDKIILYDDKINIYYKFDKRSPDDNGRDFLFYTEETDTTILLNQYVKSVEDRFTLLLFC